MMPGSNARDAADALVAQFGTKIFHANGDAETNDWCQRLFGQHTQRHLIARQGDYGEGQLRIDEQLMQEPLAPCHTFASLGKGAPGQASEAIVFQSGRRWKASGATLLRAKFSMERP